ncbi:putative Major facilitator superfamily (MFS) profile domain-containing protein [Seiridium unicorne]|uniref:Major facilitator superfamily (MFS) profile domain-containing protein n=1 Tax=Seiridium unicorne TaxID=138068 RepID=A0ABR2V721_9PEZI
MTKQQFGRVRGRSMAEMGTTETTPFPIRQMLVLAICRICEPIAFMGIFPYIYFMVKDFHMTEDESKISLYAGMVTSAFTFAEFATGVLWGRLSDRIGRKPVLLTGLVGTAISVLIFGFSPNLYVALAARAVGGLLNGNMGVLQSTVAELITDKAHQPRAYTIMPVVWCLGSIVGPMIGGALAKPCESYPTLFSQGTIWDRYPYLLPNLFSAFICLVGVVNGLLFLEETHSAKKQQRDRGIEVGKWLLSMIPCVASRGPSDHADQTQSKYDEWSSESRPLLEEQLPGYRTTENSPENSPRLATSEVIEEPRELLDLDAGLRGSSKIFTRPVVLNVVAFGILAFHTMTYDSLFPVFLSTPHSENPAVRLPFKFSDGLAMPQQEIGIILSAQGIYSLLINMAVVPWAIKRFGPLRLFRFLAVSYFLLYLSTPYIVLLPGSLRTMGIYVLLIWKCTFSNMAYPSNAILTANYAPSKHVLGNINGVAASTASLCRGFGPIFAGLLYGIGLKSGYSGLAWWCSALVAIVGGVVALRIPEQPVLCEKRQDDLEAQTS